MPRGADNDIKLCMVKQFLVNNAIAILTFTESNTCWDVVVYNQRLPQQAWGWWETAQWSLGFSKMDKHPLEYQAGGIGVLVVNKLVHRASCPGANPMGLGQWCWAQIQSQANQHIRIILLYQLCKLDCPTTSYKQHVLALAQSNWNKCPQKAVLEHIYKANKEWQVGDGIILLTDINDDVWDWDIMQHF